MKIDKHTDQSITSLATGFVVAMFAFVMLATLFGSNPGGLGAVYADHGPSGFTAAECSQRYQSGAFNREQFDACMDHAEENPGGADPDAATITIPSNIGELGSANELGLPGVSADQSQFQNILNIVFMIAGALATIFIIVGGIQYVMSIGSPERIEKAKNSVLYAVIGLVVTILASVIVNFVVSNIL